MPLEERRAVIHQFMDTVAALPVLDDRSPEDIIGFDKQGPAL